MKNFLKSVLIAATVAGMAVGLSGCGNGQVQGVEYKSYGFVNEESVKNPNVHYEISASSVIWGIILSETIVIPLYIVGWDLYKAAAPVNR